MTKVTSIPKKTDICVNGGAHNYAFAKNHSFNHLLSFYKREFDNIARSCIYTVYKSNCKSKI